jgi:hypothetical protein
MPAKRGPINGPKAHIPAPAQAEVAAAPSGLKKMTRADFIEFITKLYSESDADQSNEAQLTMNENELNSTINFLKGFKTNPENMADIIKSRGTPANPLISHDGLATLSSNLMNDHRQVLVQNSKISKSKNQNKDKNKIESITHLLYVLSNFQQELTKLQLSTKSESLIYKPNPAIGLQLLNLPFFNEVCIQQRKNKKTSDAIVPEKATGLAKFAFPEEKDFEAKYDEISTQLMENSIEMMGSNKIPLYKTVDHVSRPNAHLIPAMNKKTFVDAVKYLQIEPKIFIEEAITVCLGQDGGWHEASANLMWNLMWSPEMLENINFSIGCHPLQETLEFSVRLFQGSYISTYRNYPGMNLGDDPDVRSEYINNVVKLSGALVNKTKAGEKTQCQLVDVTDQTPVALLHKKFADFTVQNISYLSMMQDFYVVNAYATRLKESLTAKEEKSEKDEKYLKKLAEDKQYLEDAVYVKRGHRLSTEWKAIQILANTVEKYQTIAQNDEDLLQMLTDDVATDFGLNTVALNTFDCPNPSTNAIVHFAALNPHFTWDGDIQWV